MRCERPGRELGDERERPPDDRREYRPRSYCTACGNERSRDRGNRTTGHVGDGDDCGDRDAHVRCGNAVEHDKRLGRGWHDCDGESELAIGKDSTLSDFLVAGKGMTLYLFTKDTPNTSNCYDQRAQAWPPLLTQGKAKAGSGLDGTLMGTTTRTDGTTQVTYEGWPLYYYAKDTKAGDVTGQKFGGAWFVVSLKGENIDK